MANKGRRTGTKNRKSQQRENSKYQRREQYRDEDRSSGDMNDPQWYTLNEQMLRDAASFNFSNMQGLPMDITGKYEWPSGTFVNSEDPRAFVVPGLIALKYRPTVGISTDNFSAVNIAARNIYSYVRHANSGHSNYDAPDLMKYILGMDSIYGMYSYCMRIYGLAGSYSVYNRYLPRLLIQANGVNYDDLIANLAQYRYRLNILATKAGSLCAPDSMSYVTRHVWMNANVWKDSIDEKSGLYMFVPTGVYQYSDPTEVGDTALKFVSFNIDTVKNYSAYLDILESCIDSMMSSEDCGIMSGDILKAFGDHGVVRLPLVSEDYRIYPNYSEEVLVQIQNSKAYGSIAGAKIDTQNITEDATSGALLYNPTMQQADSAGGLMDVVYNTTRDRTDPGNVMVGTRLCAMPATESTITSGGIISNLYTFDTMGTEYVERYSIYTGSVDTNRELSVSRTDFWSRIRMDDENVTQLSLMKTIQKIALVSKFDFHPQIELYLAAPDSVTDVTSYNFFGDLDNYTVMHRGDIDRMNESALIAEFNVPLMGGWATKTE